MTHQLKYSTLTNLDEARRLGKILEQCFIGSPGSEDTYFQRIGIENFRILHQSQEIVGGLAMIPMGQWFGGQCVPMTGIASVGIAPEYRGSGSAIAMMQHAVQEMHAQGVPLSALYPATQQLYRKAGYEQGGTYCGWKISTESIGIKGPQLPIISLPIDSDVVYELYDKQARQINGYLNRHQAIWQRIRSSDENETLYTYLIGTKEQPQGYIIFSQHRQQGESLLEIKDWVMLSSASVQSFWAFLANHRSQIDKIQWKSSPTDLLTLFLPEQVATVRFADRWLLRVIDVKQALAQRGYPPEIQAELHLEVQDDLLAENNGKFILSVTNGRGELASGGKGELKLDIKGLAPLYTGLFTPYQLWLARKLEATETSLLAATQIFAGTSPWIADFF